VVRHPLVARIVNAYDARDREADADRPLEAITTLDRTDSA
jgi:phosphate starvation-inducible protein PhoH